MKFGKLPPRLDHRNLMFADYRSTVLPQARPAASTLYRVLDKIPTAIPETLYEELFPMDGNDFVGDCTIAGKSHLIALWDGLFGTKTIIPEADVLADYKRLTGGPDTGLDLLTVLKDWKTTPFKGNQIQAYMSIDITDHSQFQQAIDLFGAVYLGFQVQQDCLAQFNAGIPWVPGPMTQDGHCVVAVSYSQQYIRVLTWGKTQLATWSWVDACVDEAFVICPQEAEESGFAPGFAYDQLEADIAAL